MAILATKLLLIACEAGRLNHIAGFCAIQWKVSRIPPSAVARTWPARKTGKWLDAITVATPFAIRP